MVALAHHGHLDQPEGKDFVEFIVRQCCLPDTPPPTQGKKPTPSSSFVSSLGVAAASAAAVEAEVTNESVRQMCESALHLLSKAGGKAEKMLWPHLLEYLMVAEYTPAVPAVLRGLGHLAAKRQE